MCWYFNPPSSHFFLRIYWTCFSAKTYQMLKDGYQSYSLLTSSLIIYSLTNSVPGSKKPCIFHFHCSSIQNLTMNPPKNPNYTDIIQYPSFWPINLYMHLNFHFPYFGNSSYFEQKDNICRCSGSHITALPKLHAKITFPLRLDIFFFLGLRL